MPEELIGRVSSYFAKIGVAAIEVTSGTLSVGDKIHVKGHTTDFELVIESMQIEHQSVQTAKAGDSIGIRVPGKCRDHDQVFKVIP